MVQETEQKPPVESLLKLCCKIIVEESVLRESIRSSLPPIPPDIADHLAILFREYALDNCLNTEQCSNFYSQLQDADKMTRIEFARLPINNATLVEFLQHHPYLREINIAYCDKLLEDGLDNLREHVIDYLLRNRKLTSLNLGYVFTGERFSGEDWNSVLVDLPLQKLTIWESRSLRHALPRFFQSEVVKTLKILDLSRSRIETEVFASMSSLACLETLILDGCIEDYIEVVPFILALKTLKTLIISHSLYRCVSWVEELREDVISRITVLRSIVEQLPDLMWLDLSGMYFGDLEADHFMEIFRSREDKPLEYLGLYMTNVDTRTLEGLPVKRIGLDLDIEGKILDLELQVKQQRLVNAGTFKDVTIRLLNRPLKTNKPVALGNLVDRLLKLHMEYRESSLINLSFKSLIGPYIQKLFELTPNKHLKTLFIRKVIKHKDNWSHWTNFHPFQYRGFFILDVAEEFVSTYIRHLKRMNVRKLKTAAEALTPLILGEPRFDVKDLYQTYFSRTMPEICSIVENLWKKNLPYLNYKNDRFFEVLSKLTKGSYANCASLVKCETWLRVVEACMHRKRCSDLLHNQKATHTCAYKKPCPYSSYDQKIFHDHFLYTIFDISRHQTLVPWLFRSLPIEHLIDHGYNHALGLLVCTLLVQDEDVWDLHQPEGERIRGRFLDFLHDAVTDWWLHFQDLEVDLSDLKSLLKHNAPSTVKSWTLCAIAMLMRRRESRFCPKMIFDSAFLVQLHQIRDNANCIYEIRLARTILFQLELYRERGNLDDLVQCETFECLKLKWHLDAMVAVKTQERAKVRERLEIAIERYTIT